MNKKSQNQNIIVNCLNAGIIIACLVLIFCLVGVFKAFAVSHKTSYNVESFHYHLESKEYAAMVDMAYEVEATNSHLPSEIQEYCATAKYYEAATLYLLYSKAGDSREAGHQHEIMENNKKLMGSYSFLAEKINEDLDINPQ